MPFFFLRLSVFKISLLGSVDRWVSPFHIKADVRLRLKEESPVIAGGAATILTQGLILLGVCVRACVCVWEREGRTNDAQQLESVLAVQYPSSWILISSLFQIHFSVKYSQLLTSGKYPFSPSMAVCTLFKRISISSQQGKFLMSTFKTVTRLQFIISLTI